MSGWIADYRKELESNIWLMPPMYHRVWQWIKYSVNHKEAKIPNRSGGFITIKPGQRATSYRQIARGVGYYDGPRWHEPNPKTIKSILDWLVVHEMITIEGNTEGTVLTVANWESYQINLAEGNTKETRKKHELDTNNNDRTTKNNDNKESGRFTPPTRADVGAYCLEQNYCVNPDKFIDYYTANGWMVGKSKIKDWKAAVRNWERREEKSKPKNQNFSQNSISGMSQQQLNEIVERKRAKKNNVDT